MKNQVPFSKSLKVCLATLVLAAGFGSIGSATQAEAAVSPAFGKYCQKYHRGSFVNSYRANGAPICTLKNHYSMRHFRINIATACRMAGGTGRYSQVAYGRFSCVTRTANRTNRRVGRWVAPNIRGYCQRYHRGSFVNHMRANGSPICTLRASHSLMHYRVNLNTACRLAGGNGRYQRVSYGRYRCQA